MQYIMGQFLGDGGLIYLPIGFKPNKFIMYDPDVGSSHVTIYTWIGVMETFEGTGQKEGWSLVEGATTLLSDDGGFAAYDSGSEGPTITEWSSGGTTVARTVTAHGTYIKTASKDFTYEASPEDVFECISGTTMHTVEPTWPAGIGETVTDGAGVIFEKVVVPTKRIGYQGVRIAAALMSNSRNYYYEAIQSDNGNKNWGDVDGWSGGIYGA